MARLLGFDFSIKTLNTKFENLVVFFDNAHMVKLIRNTFGEKKNFFRWGWKCNRILFYSKTFYTTGNQSMSPGK